MNSGNNDSSNEESISTPNPASLNNTRWFKLLKPYLRWPNPLIMKRYSFLLIIICFSLASCVEQKQEAVNQSALVTFADSLFNVHVDSSDIAGASVLVFQNGELLLDKAYGYASLELSTPMPDNASFEIGSVTKQFTAAAILKLMEAGKLSLSDDFTQYLDFDTKGRKVTIDQLLNHTSGIASYTEMKDFWIMSIHEFDRDSLVRLVEQEEFWFEPGEALIYTNSAYYFLGLIIEKLSGMSYEEYLSEQFFIPLGMNNTYYCSTSEIIQDKAYGYGYTPDGLQQKSYLDHTWPFAAGSLCSTRADLLIWLQALHQGKALNEELYQLLITPNTLNDGSPIRYAKGLTNYQNFGHSEISHGGGINGFLSDTRYFPDEDLYIVCLVNTTGPQGASFFANKLTWEILDKNEPEIVAMEIDTESIAGKYAGAVRGRTYVLEVGVLENAITVSEVGKDEIDTLSTYIGNYTWMDGNDIVMLQNGEYRVDQVYGYYVLKKE